MKEKIFLGFLFLLSVVSKAEVHHIVSTKFIPSTNDSIHLEIGLYFSPAVDACRPPLGKAISFRNDTLQLDVYYDQGGIAQGFGCYSTDTFTIGKWANVMNITVINIVPHDINSFLSPPDTMSFRPGGFIQRSLNVSAPAEGEQLWVYPNPVSNTLFIDAKRSLRSITIQDVYGKVVLYESSPGNSIGLDMLPKGLYLLKMETEDGVRTEKIIKE
ncbi:MAG: T9SS type A sorting domain-containing protein [Sphingobacteriales bacterium]|nr:MAG: T9SS type A sorting domain-containing protein [Sphingobacteriales bacterium]